MEKEGNSGAGLWRVRGSEVGMEPERHMELVLGEPGGSRGLF